MLLNPVEPRSKLPPLPPTFPRSTVGVPTIAGRLDTVMEYPSPGSSMRPPSTVVAGADDEQTGERAQKRPRTSEDNSTPDASTSTPTPSGSNGNSNNATGPSNSVRLYSCGKCSKSYARLDHLSRHVRMHTQEKPYACTCRAYISETSTDLRDRS